MGGVHAVGLGGGDWEYRPDCSRSSPASSSSTTVVAPRFPARTALCRLPLSHQPFGLLPLPLCTPILHVPLPLVVSKKEFSLPLLSAWLLGNENSVGVGDETPSPPCPRSAPPLPAPPPPHVGPLTIPPRKRPADGDDDVRSVVAMVAAALAGVAPSRDILAPTMRSGVSLPSENTGRG